MPRIDDDDDYTGDGGGLHIQGLYEKVGEREQERATDPRRIDPRWKRQHPGELPPPGSSLWGGSRERLAALEAGEPVRLASWELGGHSFPDEGIERWRRQDRSITGWLVSPDDTVTALYD